MKRIQLLLILFISCICVNSQSLLSEVKIDAINFEDTSKIKEYIKLDTNNGNLWRIGKPSKVMFNKTYSPDNAIITGLKGYYLPNTKSSFIVKFFASKDVPYDDRYQIAVDGLFKLDSDTINDYGLIEMSSDNGENWLDIMHGFGKWYYEGTNQAPILSGKLIDSWKYFIFITESMWGYSSNDSLWFRFTFISDSIDNHKEGWMIDNFKIYIYPPVGINNIVQNKDQIIISPNPVYQNDNFTISLNNIDVELIKIYDSQGKLLINIPNPVNSITLSTNQIQKGLTYIIIFDKNGKRLIKKLAIN